MEPAGWDQFKANEELFGLTTDFDEDLYTTKINKDSPSYLLMEAKAAKIANEIEKNHLCFRGERELSDDAKYFERQCNERSTDKFRYSNVWREKDLKYRPDVPKPDVLAPKRDSPHVTPSVHGSDVVIKQFRQFVHSEKERLERKRKDIVKRDKDVRLQDLRKFSKTFKLKTPVPQDLIPILTKDKARQAEMVAKLKNAAIAEPTLKQGKFETLTEGGRKGKFLLISRSDKAKRTRNFLLYAAAQ